MKDLFKKSFAVSFNGVIDIESGMEKKQDARWRPDFLRIYSRETDCWKCEADEPCTIYHFQISIGPSNNSNGDFLRKLIRAGEEECEIVFKNGEKKKPQGHIFHLNLKNKVGQKCNADQLEFVKQMIWKNKTRKQNLLRVLY